MPMSTPAWSMSAIGPTQLCEKRIPWPKKIRKLVANAFYEQKKVMAITTSATL